MLLSDEVQYPSVNGEPEAEQVEVDLFEDWFKSCPFNEPVRRVLSQVQDGCEARRKEVVPHKGPAWPQDAGHLGHRTFPLVDS
jgi:hypothetical protein